MPTLRTAERFYAVFLVPACLERADEAVLLLRQAFAEGRGRDRVLTSFSNRLPNRSFSTSRS